MNTQGEEMVKQIQKMPLDELMKKYKLQSLMLFGSVLTDHFEAYSDVDIALLGESKLAIMDLLNIELYFEKYLDRDIDVIDLRSDSVDLFVKISALNEGRSIYTTDEDGSLNDFMEEIEYYYRNNETFFAIRRRDVLS